MTTRRKVLKALGIGMVAPQLMLAQPPSLRRSRWDILVSNHAIAPAPVVPKPESWDPSAITVSWIGHATVLINFFGTTIITDPVFSDRAGINILRLFTLGTKRLVAPALSISQLPPLDLILLSHAHMDHLDLPSLKQFDRGIPVVMAKNTADILADMEFASVREIDWGEKLVFKDVTIEAFRVRHFGWRFPWEEDRSRGTMQGRSFNAFLLTKNGKSILFGGDTAYQEYFKEIGDRGIRPELAIMPIGAYDPWIRVHANPEQSAAMAAQAGAKRMMPIHWGTFTLSDEPTNEPIERLRKAIPQHSIELVIDTIGQTWQWKGDPA